MVSIGCPKLRVQGSPGRLLTRAGSAALLVAAFTSQLWLRQRTPRTVQRTSPMRLGAQVIAGAAAVVDAASMPQTCLLQRVSPRIVQRRSPTTLGAHVMVGVAVLPASRNAGATGVDAAVAGAWVDPSTAHGCF